jgi:hypothetical protein
MAAVFSVKVFIIPEIKERKKPWSALNMISAPLPPSPAVRDPPALVFNHYTGLSSLAAVSGAHQDLSIINKHFWLLLSTSLISFLQRLT